MTISTSQLQGMSKHERKFYLLWSSMSELPLMIQFHFCPGRKFSADFAVLDAMVLIETEGGVWQRGGGRHNRGTGFENDCEKYFEAAMLGYTVIRLHEKQIHAPTIQRIIDFIENKQVNIDDAIPPLRAG